MLRRSPRLWILGSPDPQHAGVEMDTERQHWLLRVIEATERAADHVGAGGDPYHRGLFADLVELRSRLLAELEDLERDA